MGPGPDDFDDYSAATVYSDESVVRITVRRTTDPSYPSGWRYTFHYGLLSATPATLDDGTLLRYDNSHERTKGHERHVAPDSEPETIVFPGIEALYDRFWDEIPKQRFDPPAGGEIDE